MVLVWLGTANEFEDICRWEDEEGYEPVSSIRLNDKFGLFLSKMSSVDYWHRVWIVQEIGKARRIRIHYGKIGVDWELFIGTMRLYRQNFSLQGSLPLRLADLMLDKYGNGYKLENLIKTHQKALCEDVRDRIYGFTGLANDTYGRLSMDYGKTPFDVWKDVVRFRNADRTVSQHDILEFAGFARQLLGNDLKGTRENIPVNDYLPIVEEPLVVNPQNELVFCPARLWGRVTWVGPTYDEIRGNLRKVDEWIASIRDRVSETYLQSAYEENDLLLQLLEDLDYTDLEMVLPIGTKIRYKLGYSDHGDGVNTMMYVKPKVPTLVEEDVAYGWYFEDMTEEKILILLDLCPSDDGRNPAALKPFTGIGLASVKVARGDFICCFYQKEKAAVVRKYNNTDQFSIVGSAVFPDVRAMATEKMKSTKKAKAKFSILNNTSLKRMETINLYMDIGMVYEWSI